MNGSLDTQLNSATQRNTTVASAPSPGSSARSSRPGMFTRLLADFGLKQQTQPMALVRSGSSVTFDSIPFVDQFGNSVDPDDPDSLRRTEESHRGRRPQTNDPHLSREMQLSSNQGTAQLMTGFKKRAAEHLLLTDQLRIGILSGEVETPGNRSYVLKKRLEEQRKEQGLEDPSMWLQEVRTHMARSQDGDAARLVAQARAMVDGEGQDASKHIELKSPFGPDVKPFAPPKVNRSTNTVQTTKVSGDGDAKPASQAGVKSAQKLDLSQLAVAQLTKAAGKISAKKAASPEFKSEMGQKPALADKSEADQPVAQKVSVSARPQPTRSDLLAQLRAKTGGTARASAWSGAGTVREDDSGLQPASKLTTPKAVSNVSVERSNETAAELAKQTEQDSSQRQGRGSRMASRPESAQADRGAFTRQSRAPAPSTQPPVTVESASSQTGTRSAAAAAASAGQARSRVASMERSGWHVHAPSGKSAPTASDRSAEGVKQAKAGQKSAKPSARSAQESATSTNTGKPKAMHAEDAADVKPAGAKPNVINNLSAALGARVGKGAPSSAQGLQNLQELMQKVSSQAKVLKGDGVVRLQVALKPAKLGNVLLNVIRSNGKYIIKMTVDRADATRSLEQHLPALREHLSSQGIQVDRVEVETGQTRQQDATADQQRRDAAERQAQRRNATSRNGQSRREQADVDPGEDSGQRPLRTGLNTIEYTG
ncbi:flagellar hook-length control protein FliK [bacterium]|nr:flagellar hook-length control protein FliK [bacterium]